MTGAQIGMSMSGAPVIAEIATGVSMAQPVGNIETGSFVQNVPTQFGK